MVIHLSEHLLKGMGLAPLSPSRPLTATFRSLHVYAVQGFTLEAASLEPISGTVAGVPYTFCVGSSVNAISVKMVRDTFVEHEEKWQTEHKCAPPYLMVLLGPTKEHECVISHAKETENIIETYGKFLFAKAELREMEENVLPALLSALACSFSSCDPPIRFVPTDRADFGITPDGRTVLDFVFYGSVQMRQTRQLEPAQIEERLVSSVGIANAMNPKVARFFQLALDDQDPLKKFLYFFLAIEIETHATFKKIDHVKNLSLLIAAPDRVAVNTRGLFDRQHQRLINLRDRFVWCVLCVWTHLGDTDVEEFIGLKDVRDGIAHGSIAKPPPAAMSTAEKLAAKLHLT
jgi:hypothetical protein